MNQIIRALQHDKKSVDGQINWVLLEKVGLPKIVDGGLIKCQGLASLATRWIAASPETNRKSPLMQTRRSTERGSANLKFLMVMLIIGACAYAGYALHSGCLPGTYLQGFDAALR